MEEVIYFSVNNWFCYENYPPTANFKKWLSNDFKQYFCDDAWCKENKLCVYYGSIDMSMNYTVSAPLSWVEKNCPELLSDDEYTYSYANDKVIHKKYSDFVSHPDENGDIIAPFDWPYLEYKEENFGCHYYDDGSEVEMYDDEEMYDEED